MRRLLFVIAIFVLLCSCGNREKYARLLAEADSLNQNYIPFTSDSTMLDVVDYYDHHGTANERMKAHYLLGCVYRDLGEAPQALECYHDAVDCADTTAQDCDYKRLSRVYGQMRNTGTGTCFTLKYYIKINHCPESGHWFSYNTSWRNDLFP